MSPSRFRPLASHRNLFHKPAFGQWLVARLKIELDGLADVLPRLLERVALGDAARQCRHEGRIAAVVGDFEHDFQEQRLTHLQFPLIDQSRLFDARRHYAAYADVGASRTRRPTATFAGNIRFDGAAAIRPRNGSPLRRNRQTAIASMGPRRQCRGDRRCLFWKTDVAERNVVVEDSNRPQTRERWPHLGPAIFEELDAILFPVCHHLGRKIRRCVEVNAGEVENIRCRNHLHLDSQECVVVVEEQGHAETTDFFDVVLAQSQIGVAFTAIGGAAPVNLDRRDARLPIQDISAIAAEIPRRYSRLQRAYGRWGLAYLEPVLRTADDAAGAAPTTSAGGDK